MSQHDMTIANDTGSNARTDIQNMGQALASTSIGNSAPSTIYQGQHWLDNNTPSASIWTEFVYDGADSIALWYVDTSTNVAYPVSAMPLLGYSAQGSPVMTGDIRTTAATAVPGSGNSTTGYNLAANGTLHNSNNGTYVHLVNRNSSGKETVWALSGTEVGSVSVSGSTTTYNTSSDYRLKFEVEPIDLDAAEEIVLALNPVTHGWIADPLGPRVFGYIAHEYAEHIPQGVTGEKDAMDGDRIAPQGMDKSTAIPVLNAALKSALLKIRALTARIEALEAR